jgi:hypothetical protein
VEDDVGRCLFRHFRLLPERRTSRRRRVATRKRHTLNRRERAERSLFPRRESHC